MFSRLYEMFSFCFFSDGAPARVSRGGKNRMYTPSGAYLRSRRSRDADRDRRNGLGRSFDQAADALQPQRKEVVQRIP